MIAERRPGHDPVAVLGEPRATEDIDIAAEISPVHVVPLVTALAAEFYVPTDRLRDAVAESCQNPIAEIRGLVTFFITGSSRCA